MIYVGKMMGGVEGGREEGSKQARKEGRKEGINEWMNEWMNEARKEGRKVKRQITSKRDQNMSQKTENWIFDIPTGMRTMLTKNITQGYIVYTFLEKTCKAWQVYTEK